MTFSMLNSIIAEYKGGMDNIYNSFFISFLAIKPLMERPMLSDFVIPIQGFSFSTLKAEQLNKLGNDSINEYVNSIRRHMLNDMMISYERYATLMFAYHANGKRIDYAHLKDRSLNASKFESLPNILTPAEQEFIVQLRRLRNSIVHYNGVYNKSNQLNYTFFNNVYYSIGHEGEDIQIEFDSIMNIYFQINNIVHSMHNRYISLYVDKDGKRNNYE